MSGLLQVWPYGARLSEQAEGKRQHRVALMGGAPVTQVQPIPIIAPDNKQYAAHIDTQASLSVVPPAIAASWARHGAERRHCPQSGQLANGTTFNTTEVIRVPVTTELGDDLIIEFAVSETPDSIIILGLPALEKLPIIIKHAGRTVFEGAPPVQVVAEKPAYPPGEGIKFQSGSPAQQKAITDILLRYQENIFEWSGKFGLFSEHVEDIPLTSDTPVQVKPYRVPVGLHDAFKDILDEYLRRKIVEPANSPYSAPAFLVPKHGASPTAIASKRFRMCCDYRKINEVTEDVMFPVPDVQQLLDALGSSNEFFATIDLRMGYHHIPLTASGRRKTAFSTPMGQYQFKVMSFGMKRSPRVFQRALHSILGDLVWKACLVYLDDIIIFGKDFDTFAANLERVVATLARAGAAISIDKSCFLARETKFLGFIVDKDSCRPDPSTVQAIHDFPRPTTQREMLRFIGLASYVRQFIPNFAAMEQRLRAAIVATNKPILWTRDAAAAFDDVKAGIAKDARLRRFDPQLYTEVQCDASKTTMGAVLLQGPDPEHLHVLEYASKSLQPAETRYSNTERELYAIKWAVTDKFRPYLEGREFTVATDHQALLRELKLKDPSRRIVYFKSLLAGYRYQLRHIKGTANTVADALSRVAPPLTPGTACQRPLSRVSQAESGSRLAAFQLTDSNVQPTNATPQFQAPTRTYADALKGGPQAAPATAPATRSAQPPTPALASGEGTNTCQGTPPRLIQGGGELRSVPVHEHSLSQPDTNLLPQLPVQPHVVQIDDPAERAALLDQCHKELGHAGWKAVFNALRTRFFWPRMRQMAFQRLHLCHQCLRHNVPTTAVGTHLEPIQSTGPRHILAIDVVPMPVTNRYRYMILAVDHYSKYAFAQPVPTAKAYHIVNFLRQLFLQLGPFETLLSDPGPQFRSKALKEFLQRHQVRHDTSGRRHFEGNGCLERLVRTITETAAKMGATRADWPNHLDRALQAYNVRPHSTTGAEPYAVFFNRPVQLHLDAKYATHGPPVPTPGQIQVNHETATGVWRRASQKRRSPPFQPGDDVLHCPRLPTTLRHSRDRRFLPRRAGPYCIIERYPRNRYLATDGVKQYLLPGWELQRYSYP
ncbi:MAG: reverse transcriptase domain-containing protein [Chromatiaceae bacterium]|nr:reverse transcriptase domain-containing protein [Candidatus Thioaporhodococcus sediminis]